MNNDIDNQLSVLQAKLQQLLKLCKLLQKENMQLKKELEKKQLVNEKPFGEINNYAESLDSKTKFELQRKIDAYLKEIDNCLLLLNATA